MHRQIQHWIKDFLNGRTEQVHLNEEKAIYWSGLPQRTEARRRRVDLIKKRKENKTLFLFFCLAVKQISITNVFLLSTILFPLSLSLFLVGCPNLFR